MTRPAAAQTRSAPDRRVSLTPVAVALLPIGFVSRPGDDALYVVEKPGRVRALRGGLLAPELVLDITGRVSFEIERGLLSIAFADRDPTKMWVVYTARSGTWTLSEFAFVDGRADAASERILLTIPKRTNVHHGGALVFDEEGLLLISIGDGGPNGDPANKAQRLDVLEGKVLRIDPFTRTGSLPYGIPPTNPFAASAPRATPRAEIVAYGLRNPWRMTHDPVTGSVWIGDVGQSRFEEINVLRLGPKAVNFGWRFREGAAAFSGERPPGVVDPVHSYAHAKGRCAVVMGPVYRGTRLAGLTGAALFGDFCSGEIRALVPDQSATTYAAVSLGAKTPELASFGTDWSGEVYVVSKSGTISRLDPPR